MHAGGGTNLSLGIQAGFNELRSLEQPSLLSRAIFLTDMESGASDEARVIQGEIAYCMCGMTSNAHTGLVAKDQANGIHKPLPTSMFQHLPPFSPAKPSSG